MFIIVCFVCVFVFVFLQHFFAIKAPGPLQNIYTCTYMYKYTVYKLEIDLYSVIHLSRACVYFLRKLLL